MIIGVPKEIKKHEYRVGLIPKHAEEYIKAKHPVYIQKGAGIGSGFSDEEYLAVGAKILDTIEEIYSKAEMIIKVKEPLEPEYNLLKKGQILYTYLHLAASLPLTQVLLKQKVTSIAYETIVDDFGKLPCLKPMSEVAGRLAVQEGAKFLEKESGGRGILLGGTETVKPGVVMVIGANGVAGYNATQIALGVQANVIAIDVRTDKLDLLKKIYPKQLTILASNEANISSSIKDADLVISTVLVPGDAAPKIIKREYLKTMKPGSVIVDVAIDQGGSTETSRVTYHDDPIYVVDGVIHYCVGNMPGAVPRTSAEALGNATIKYGLKIANFGYKKALSEDHGLSMGLNTFAGNVTCEPVAKLFKLPLLKIEDALR